MTREQIYAIQDIKNFFDEFGQTIIWKKNAKEIDSQTGQYIDFFDRKEIKIIVNNAAGNIVQGDAARLENEELDITTIHGLSKDDEVVLNGVDYIVGGNIASRTVFDKGFTLRTIKIHLKSE